MRYVLDIFRLPSVIASDLEKSVNCTQRACWEGAQQLWSVETLLYSGEFMCLIFTYFLKVFFFLLIIFSEWKWKLPPYTLHLNNCGISPLHLKSTYQTSVVPNI